MKYVFFFIAFFVFTRQAGQALGEAPETRQMVPVPAGDFLMGIEEADPLGLVWSAPQRKVFLPGFYIDKYEVTNKEYKRFVDATGHRAPFDANYDTIYNWKNGTYPENLEDHPVVIVDIADAEAYCRWEGKRLPTEEEWEKAARGTDARLYPWGGEFSRFKANTKDFHVLMSMPVGSFKEGASPYGAMDMAGNVFEWTSSWYKPYPGNKRNHKDFGEQYKVTRGGGWTSFAEPYAYVANRIAQMPMYKHRSTGFRCAKGS